MEFAMVLLNYKLHDPVDQGVIYSYPSLVVCRYFLSSLFPHFFLFLFPFSYFLCQRNHLWKMRKYYFCVDKRGLLFNDEFVKSGLRNIATALKDKTFLDVTFKMLRPLKPDDYLINNNHKYTHISPCRGELNYVRCLDPNSSLVFTSLENRENILSYAGNLTHPFDVNLLRVHNGYMYHKITHHRHLKDTYGLLHPDIAFHLTSTTTCESQSGGTCQEENFFIHYKGKNHLICDQELN